MVFPSRFRACGAVGRNAFDEEEVALELIAMLNRDYPVMFGTLWVFGLLGLLMGLVGDLMYVAVDPRIDFSARTA